MGCRIGITTDPDGRRSHWESVYRNLRDWQILAGPYPSKEEAQRMETELARKNGCESHPGGDDAGGLLSQWYVYGFNHDEKK